MAWVRNKWFGWFGSGTLLGGAFLIEPLWWVGFVGAAWFLVHAARADRLRIALLGGWYAWFVKGLAATAWFWSVYPVEWLGYDLGSKQLGFIALGWVIAAAGLACGGLLVAGGVWVLARTRSVSGFWFVLVPLLWLLAEVVGAFGFSLVSLGEGGSITGAFSFGMTGYLLAAHPWLLLAAQWFGVYGLSFIFILLVVVGGWLARRYSPGFALACLVLLGASALIPLPNQTPDELMLRVVTIDTVFPVAFATLPENDQFVRSELTQAVRAALAAEPDFVLLPEDAGLFPPPTTSSTVRAFLQSEFGTTSATLIDSRDVTVNGVRVLRSYIYEGSTARLFRADKQYLVPQGEFLPAVPSQLLRWLGYGEFVERIGQNIAFRPGPLASQAHFPDALPAVLFCFESVDPVGVWSVLQERPQAPFVAHPISHAWFHTPRILWFNLDRMLRVQALWNDVPIVSAGSHGAGKLYQPDGTIIEPETVADDEYWEVRIVELTR